MIRFLQGYIERVDAFNYRIGRVAVWLVFVMAGVLLWSSASKTFFHPALWTLETSQFLMMAYFILGGPYAMQLGAHVRMDLLYAPLSLRRKAWIDAITVLCLLFYLGVTLYGALSSTTYAFDVMERSRTAWRPYMWPIKTIMSFGIFLMLLQALSELAKDILRLKGVGFAEGEGERERRETEEAAHAG